jgi:hypothetical protein
LQQNWATAEGRFILFRLLAVAAWPAAIPQLGEQPGPLTAALGTVFDQLAAKPHRSRPFSNAWASWAARWLTRFHQCYYAHWRGVALAPPQATLH